MKPIYIFNISRNYTRCEVWAGSRTFKNRISRSIVTPDKGLTRKERYQVIGVWLYERFGIPGPSYRPLKSERGEKGTVGDG